MRIKIYLNMLEKQTNEITTHHHIYSAILANLSKDRAETIHNKERMIRMFSFTSLYQKGNNAHFYICGQDDIIQDFINHLCFNKIIKIGGQVFEVIHIEQLDDLKEKPYYIFKTKFIINNSIDGKCRLSEDIKDMERRLEKNIIKKSELQGINTENKVIDIKILNTIRKATMYKNSHILNYKGNLLITGDKELIDVAYQCGLGESTSTGHGFLWEARIV